MPNNAADHLPQSEAPVSGDEGLSEDTSNVESLDEARSLKSVQNDLEVAQSELELARARIKALEAKISDYETKFVEARSYLKKLESEVQDIRQRSERDAQKKVDAKVGGLAHQLLPIVDLFELSLRSATESKAKDFDAFIKGIELIAIQMNQALQGLGLEKIETKDQDFDPNVHEAVLTEAVLSPDLDGKIIREMKAGYRLAGQVVRPAQVSVGKAP